MATKFAQDGDGDGDGDALILTHTDTVMSLWRDMTSL